ncbi:MAG: hypothetical protein ACM65L_07050 [Microcoleus sp.]
MKITASEKGIKASGKIRGQKGNAGISEDGIVELGLDIKVAEIGISTDYGGSIIVGFAGQKIVWGLEGGRLLIKFGGIFEVEVEARDCVVTETKKIAGQIVASRTYPDPGCKLPEPEPEPEPIVDPDPVKGVKIPDTDQTFWVGVTARRTSPKAVVESRAQFVSKTSDFVDNWLIPFTLNMGAFVDGEKVDSLGGFGFGTQVKQGKTAFFNFHSLYYHYWNSAEPPSGRIVRVFYAHSWGFITGFLDTGKNINAWLQELRAYNGRLLNSTDYNLYGNAYIIDYIPVVFVPLGEQEKPLLLLPSPGNRPPMPETCCEALKADIEDIKTVLAVKEMLQGKLTFPWRLRMPGGQGEEVIKNYPNLARAMVQVIDHLGIHPPKLSIKDINNAIAGDQSVSNQFPSATQGFEALMAQVWDANADVDTLTNFLYRLSWLCVQQSMNLAVVSADIQSIKDMIGGKTTPDKATITTPFNIGAGIKESSTRGKGFGKNKSGEIDKRIDANTELSTESLLPDFLKIRDNDVIIERYAGDRDVVDMLSLILLKLETLSAR